MAQMFSAPINLIRYDNGKVVKLTASASEFVSFDYDLARETGTFDPDEITIDAVFQGDIAFGKWQYSRDGQYWSDVTSSSGLTYTAKRLTIPSNWSQFSAVNTSITFKCVSSDGEHEDTVTISRIVDPVTVYKQTSTQIQQNSDKIALIASSEELSQWNTRQTMATKMAAIETKADGILQTVQADYQTKDAMGDYVLDTNLSSKIRQTVNGIDLTVENKSIKTALDGKADTDYVASQISQSADKISEEIWKTVNGQAVLAAASVTDAEGLHVSTAGQSSTANVDGEGMKVTKKVGSATEVIAEFTVQRAYTKDLTIAGYSSFGAHRIEGISGKEWDGTTVLGTAWAWIGEIE